MAAMTTALTTFSDSENKRTSTLANHTALKAELCLETRKVPTGNASMIENTVKVVIGTVDSDSAPLLNKVSFEAKIRYPVAGAAADLAIALAYYRSIIAGDEFGAMATSQNWLSNEITP